ncbi:unnamed protein product [Amaranthus hypochondriacus]
MYDEEECFCHDWDWTLFFTFADKSMNFLEVSSFDKGFRKVDPDKWEFANEGFLRGNKHLLKNIHRRKSHHSQQLTLFGGSSSESEIGSEIEKLKKEKSELMQEVIELQQQQRGTAQRVERVKDRLWASEQRQKQMVSFLAKVIQNPVFVDRLKEMKEQKTLVSPRTKKKFLKQKQHEGGTSVEGEIVRYGSDFEDLKDFPSSDIPMSSCPDYLLEDVLGKSSGAHITPSPIGDIPMEYMEIPGPIGASSSGVGDPFSKGKQALTSQPEPNPDYLVSFPEELSRERTFPTFSSGIGNMIKQEEVWSMGFDLSTDISSSSPALWGNIADYGLPEIGASCPGEFSDVLDLGALQVGNPGVENWSGDDSQLGHPESKDDVSKNK